LILKNEGPKVNKFENRGIKNAFKLKNIVRSYFRNNVVED